MKTALKNILHGLIITSILWAITLTAATLIHPVNVNFTFWHNIEVLLRLTFDEPKTLGIFITIIFFAILNYLIQEVRANNFKKQNSQ